MKRKLKLCYLCSTMWSSQYSKNGRKVQWYKASLLDNTPNYLVGYVIQKRYIVFQNWTFPPNFSSLCHTTTRGRFWFDPVLMSEIESLLYADIFYCGHNSRTFCGGYQNYQKQFEVCQSPVNTIQFCSAHLCAQKKKSNVYSLKGNRKSTRRMHFENVRIDR